MQTSTRFVTRLSKYTGPEASKSSENEIRKNRNRWTLGASTKSFLRTIQQTLPLNWWLVVSFHFTTTDYRERFFSLTLFQAATFAINWYVCSDRRAFRELTWAFRKTEKKNQKCIYRDCWNWNVQDWIALSTIGGERSLLLYLSWKRVWK